MKITDWLIKAVGGPERAEKLKAKVTKKADRELARIEKKERKKEMRAYLKMHRRHRKELVKLVKETHEWDWGWLHDMIIMQVRHMHEFYSNGNNVWQCDESRMSTIEQLQHILDLEAEITQMQDDDHGAEYSWEGGVLTATYPDDYRERVDKWFKKEQELYNELYSSIGLNLRHWWD